MQKDPQAAYEGGCFKAFMIDPHTNKFNRIFFFRKSNFGAIWIIENMQTMANHVNNALVWSNNSSPMLLLTIIFLVWLFHFILLMLQKLLVHDWLIFVPRALIIQAHFSKLA